MLKKIFQKNVSLPQLLGAAVGAIIGLLLLFLALQTYLDWQTILRGGKNSSQSVATINKQVGMLNMLFKNGFSASEVAEVKAEPYVIETAAFTASRFKVSASSRTLGFYTELFFEAVPDVFVDADKRVFHWQEGQNVIPIVMPRDYLTLYNFGFAMSQGLPQFTPTTIGQLTVDVTLRGRGQERLMQGKIVGFSERINSIIVPQQFIDWANAQYGEGEAPTGASRLLLKLDGSKAGKRFEEFLKAHNYEVSGSKLERMSPLLQSVLSVVGVVAVLMTLLAVLIFVLNYQLIIARSAADIRLLLQIGYRHGDVSQVLRGQLWRLLLPVFAVVLLVLAVLRPFWVAYISRQGFELSSWYDWRIFAAVGATLSAIVVVNVWNIRRAVLAAA
jgi:hypothetical protein